MVSSLDFGIFAHFLGTPPPSPLWPPQGLGSGWGWGVPGPLTVLLLFALILLLMSSLASMTFVKHKINTFWNRNWFDVWDGVWGLKSGVAQLFKWWNMLLVSNIYFWSHTHTIGIFWKLVACRNRISLHNRNVLTALIWFTLFCLSGPIYGTWLLHRGKPGYVRNFPMQYLSLHWNKFIYA